MASVSGSVVGVDGVCSTVLDGEYLTAVALDTGCVVLYHNAALVGAFQTGYVHALQWVSNTVLLCLRGDAVLRYVADRTDDACDAFPTHPALSFTPRPPTKIAPSAADSALTSLDYSMHALAVATSTGLLHLSTHSDALYSRRAIAFGPPADIYHAASARAAADARRQSSERGGGGGSGGATWASDLHTCTEAAARAAAASSASAAAAAAVEEITRKQRQIRKVAWSTVGCQMAVQRADSSVLLVLYLERPAAPAAATADVADADDESSSAAADAGPPLQVTHTAFLSHPEEDGLEVASFEFYPGATGDGRNLLMTVLSDASIRFWSELAGTPTYVLTHGIAAAAQPPGRCLAAAFLHPSSLVAPIKGAAAEAGADAEERPTPPFDMCPITRHRAAATAADDDGAATSAGGAEVSLLVSSKNGWDVVRLLGVNQHPRRGVTLVWQKVLNDGAGGASGAPIVRLTSCRLGMGLAGAQNFSSVSVTAAGPNGALEVALYERGTKMVSLTRPSSPGQAGAAPRNTHVRSLALHARHDMLASVDYEADGVDLWVQTAPTPGCLPALASATFSGGTSPQSYRVASFSLRALLTRSLRVAASGGPGCDAAVTRQKLELSAVRVAWHPTLLTLFCSVKAEVCSRMKAGGGTHVHERDFVFALEVKVHGGSRFRAGDCLLSDGHPSTHLPVHPGAYSVTLGEVLYSAVCFSSGDAFDPFSRGVFREDAEGAPEGVAVSPAPVVVEVVDLAAAHAAKKAEARAEKKKQREAKRKEKEAEEKRKEEEESAAPTGKQAALDKYAHLIAAKKKAAAEAQGVPAPAADEPPAAEAAEAEPSPASDEPEVDAKQALRNKYAHLLAAKKAKDEAAAASAAGASTTASTPPEPSFGATVEAEGEDEDEVAAATPPQHAARVNATVCHIQTVTGDSSDGVAFLCFTLLDGRCWVYSLHGRRRVGEGGLGRLNTRLRFTPSASKKEANDAAASGRCATPLLAFNMLKGGNRGADEEALVRRCCFSGYGGGVVAAAWTLRFADGGGAADDGAPAVHAVFCKLPSADACGGGGGSSSTPGEGNCVERVDASLLEQGAANVLDVSEFEGAFIAACASPEGAAGGAQQRSKDAALYVSRYCVEPYNKGACGTLVLGRVQRSDAFTTYVHSAWPGMGKGGGVEEREVLRKWGELADAADTRALRARVRSARRRPGSSSSSSPPPPPTTTTPCAYFDRRNAAFLRHCEACVRVGSYSGSGANNSRCFHLLVHTATMMSAAEAEAAAAAGGGGIGVGVEGATPLASPLCSPRLLSAAQRSTAGGFNGGNFLTAAHVMRRGDDTLSRASGSDVAGGWRRRRGGGGARGASARSEVSAAVFSDAASAGGVVNDIQYPRTPTEWFSFVFLDASLRVFSLAEGVGAGGGSRRKVAGHDFDPFSGYCLMARGLAKLGGGGGGEMTQGSCSGAATSGRRIVAARKGFLQHMRVVKRDEGVAGARAEAVVTPKVLPRYHPDVLGAFLQGGAGSTRAALTLYQLCVSVKKAYGVDVGASFHAAAHRGVLGAELNPTGCLDHVAHLGPVKTGPSMRGGAGRPKFATAENFLLADSDVCSFEESGRRRSNTVAAGGGGEDAPPASPLGYETGFVERVRAEEKAVLAEEDAFEEARATPHRGLEAAFGVPLDEVVDLVASSALPGMAKADLRRAMTMLEVEQARAADGEALDEAGLHVAHEVRVAAPVAARAGTGRLGLGAGGVRLTEEAPPLSWPSVVWALHSDCTDSLLDIVQNKVYRSAFGFEVMLALKVPLWLKSNSVLRDLCEKMANAQFQEKKDPRDAALLYAALGKRSVLVTLFKVVGEKRLSDFFDRDFEQPQHKAAASKNAGASVTKGNFLFGAAFYILAGRVEDAAQIILERTNDFVLAYLVLRLVDATPLVGPLLTSFLQVKQARLRHAVARAGGQRSGVAAPPAAGDDAADESVDDAGLPPRGDRHLRYFAHFVEWKLGDYKGAFHTLLGAGLDTHPRLYELLRFTVALPMLKVSEDTLFPTARRAGLLLNAVRHHLSRGNLTLSLRYYKAFDAMRVRAEADRANNDPRAARRRARQLEQQQRAVESGQIDFSGGMFGGFGMAAAAATTTAAAAAQDESSSDEEGDGACDDGSQGLSAAVLRHIRAELLFRLLQDHLSAAASHLCLSLNQKLAAHEDPACFAEAFYAGTFAPYVLGVARYFREKAAEVYGDAEDVVVPVLEGLLLRLVEYNYATKSNVVAFFLLHSVAENGFLRHGSDAALDAGVAAAEGFVLTVPDLLLRFAEGVYGNMHTVALAGERSEEEHVEGAVEASAVGGADSLVSQLSCLVLVCFGALGRQQPGGGSGGGGGVGGLSARCFALFLALLSELMSVAWRERNVSLMAGLCSGVEMLNSAVSRDRLPALAALFVRRVLGEKRDVEEVAVEAWADARDNLQFDGKDETAAPLAPAARESMRHLRILVGLYWLYHARCFFMTAGKTFVEREGEGGSGSGGGVETLVVGKFYAALLSVAGRLAFCALQQSDVHVPSLASVSNLGVAFEEAVRVGMTAGFIIKVDAFLVGFFGGQLLDVGGDASSLPHKAAVSMRAGGRAYGAVFTDGWWHDVRQACGSNKALLRVLSLVDDFKRAAAADAAEPEAAGSGSGGATRPPRYFPPVLLDEGLVLGMLTDAANVSRRADCETDAQYRERRAVEAAAGGGGGGGGGGDIRREISTLNMHRPSPSLAVQQGVGAAATPKPLTGLGVSATQEYHLFPSAAPSAPPPLPLPNTSLGGRSGSGTAAAAGGGEKDGLTEVFKAKKGPVFSFCSSYSDKQLIISHAKGLSELGYARAAAPRQLPPVVFSPSHGKKRGASHLDPVYGLTELTSADERVTVNYVPIRDEEAKKTVTAHPSAPLFAAGGFDGVSLYSCGNPHPLRSFRGSAAAKDSMSKLRFSHNGCLLVAVDGRGYVDLWRVEGETPGMSSLVVQSQAHKDTAADVMFLDDGSVVATVGGSKTGQNQLIIHDLLFLRKGGHPGVATANLPTDFKATCMARLEGRDDILIGGRSGQVCLYDLRNLYMPVYNQRVHDRSIHAVAVHPTQPDLAALGTSDGDIMLLHPSRSLKPFETYESVHPRSKLGFSFDTRGSAQSPPGVTGLHFSDSLLFSSGSDGRVCRRVLSL